MVLCWSCVQVTNDTEVGPLILEQLGGRGASRDILEIVMVIVELLEKSLHNDSIVDVLGVYNIDVLCTLEPRGIYLSGY